MNRLTARTTNGHAYYPECFNPPCNGDGCGRGKSHRNRKTGEKMSEQLKQMEDMQECRLKLLEAFPGSFINERDEFIAHPRTNQYICLGGCKTPLDIECKVLEWFSRPACKTAPYSQKWRNRKFHEFIRNGVNDFLDTGFSEQEMLDIYGALGNAINHEKTIRFVESGYDFAVLEGG